MRDHRKLHAFQLADELVMRIYSATRNFPDDERYGLSAQLRRAAVSVGANIVEGAARPSEGDYVWFLTIAYGSAKELQYELSIADRLGYLAKPDSRQMKLLSVETSRVLWALIAALRASSSSLSPVARSP